jgi:hypothetical protein
MEQQKNRDRLDGTQIQSPWVEFLLKPGRFILWIQYMLPKAGYRNIRMSSRHARSPVMTIIYSCLFWGSVVISILSFFFDLR